MSNAYVDPWDILNNFSFHVYVQMSLFIGENGNDIFAYVDPWDMLNNFCFHV